MQKDTLNPIANLILCLLYLKKGDVKKDQKGKLQEFDDVACKYNSKMDLGVMEFNSSCSRLEGKLKLGMVE